MSRIICELKLKRIDLNRIVNKSEKFSLEIYQPLLHHFPPLTSNFDL